MKIFISTITIFFFIGLFSPIGGAVKLEGLLLYLPFDEVSGGKAKDLSGNGFDGNLNGGVKLVDGKVNKALEFNGTDGFVTVGPLGVDPDEFTIEFWFSPQKDLDSGGARMDLIYAHTGCCRPHITFNRQNDGGMGFHAEFGGNGAQGPTTDLITKTSSWKLGEWYHWVGTADENETKVFVNGKVEKTLKAPGNATPNLRYEEFGISIGCSQGQSNWFSGKLDEIRVWSRVLTDNEIKKAFDGTLMAIEKKDKLAITWGAIKSK